MSGLPFMFDKCFLVLRSLKGRVTPLVSEKLGLQSVVHICNPSKAGTDPVQGQPGLHTCLQERKKRGCGGRERKGKMKAAAF